MKNNRGITLTILIMTIVLLLIIAGLGVYYGIESFNASKVVKFETYMKIIQKKVDILVEEKVDYRTLGEALTEEQEIKLKEIIDKDSNVKTTKSELVTETGIRYFSKSDIIEYFEIEDIKDEIIVNFTNREVISLNGVEVNGKIHYVEDGIN